MSKSSPLTNLSPAAHLLGRSIEEGPVASGGVKLHYEAKPAFENRHGTIAGGFLAAMLDSATAAPVLLALDDTKTVVTTDLHVSFVSPAHAGPLVATAAVVSQGEREIRAKGELSDLEGRVVARATATFRVLDRKPSVANLAEVP